MLLKLLFSMFILNVNALEVNVNTSFNQSTYKIGEEIQLNVDYSFDEDSLIQVEVTPTNFNLNQTTKATSSWSRSGQFVFKGQAINEGEISVSVKVVEVVNKEDKVIENKIFYTKAKVESSQPQHEPSKPIEQPIPQVQNENRNQGENVSVVPPIQTVKEEKPISIATNQISGEIKSLPSSDNYLKGQLFKDLNIYPQFQNEVTHYILGLNTFHEKLDLKFEPVDSKSKVSIKQKTVQLGDRVEVDVVSESGEKRTYIFEIGLKDKKPFLQFEKEVLLGIEDLKPTFLTMKELKLNHQTIKTKSIHHYYIIQKVEGNQLQLYYFKDGVFSPYIEAVILNQNLVLQPYNENRVKPSGFDYVEYTFRGRKIQTLKHQKDNRVLLYFYKEDGSELILEYNGEYYKEFENLVVTKSFNIENVILITLGSLLGITVVGAGIGYYVLKRKQNKENKNKVEE